MRKACEDWSGRRADERRLLAAAAAEVQACLGASCRVFFGTLRPSVGDPKLRGGVAHVAGNSAGSFGAVHRDAIATVTLSGATAKVMPKVRKPAGGDDGDEDDETRADEDGGDDEEAAAARAAAAAVAAAAAAAAGPPEKPYVVAPLVSAAYAPGGLPSVLGVVGADGFCNQQELRNDPLGMREYRAKLELFVSGRDKAAMRVKLWRKPASRHGVAVASPVSTGARAVCGRVVKIEAAAGGAGHGDSGPAYTVSWEDASKRSAPLQPYSYSYSCKSCYCHARSRYTTHHPPLLPPATKSRLPSPLLR